jgi:hypothetical protein
MHRTPRQRDQALLVTKGIRSTIPSTPFDYHLVSVAVVMTGVLVLVGGLVDDGCLGGVALQPCATGVGH